MSLNSKQYYTSGRTLKSKGNQTMLNNIEKNAYNPTRKLVKKRKSFVNPELDEMKCGGKVHKMEFGDEVPSYTTFPYFPKVKTEAEKEEEARLAKWPAYRPPNLTAEQIKQLHEDSKFGDEFVKWEKEGWSRGGYEFQPKVGQTYDEFTIEGGFGERGLGIVPDHRVWDGKKWVGQQHTSTDPVDKDEQDIADKLREQFKTSDEGVVFQNQMRERMAQEKTMFSKPNPLALQLAKRQFQKQNPETVGYELGYGGLTKMPDGGEYFKTKLSDKDEKKFQKFFKTLPDNLRVDDDLYDIRGYWDAEGRPNEFDYSQPKESDGYYHAYTRHPKTGKILKSPAHSTFAPAMEYETAKRVDVYGNVYTGLPEMPNGGERKNKLKRIVTTYTNPQSNDDEIVAVGKKTSKKYTDEDAHKDKMLIYNDNAHNVKVWEEAKTKDDVRKTTYTGKGQDKVYKAYDRLVKHNPNDPWLKHIINPPGKIRTLSDGFEWSVHIFDHPDAAKYLIETEEKVSDHPEGWVPIYYQGKPLPVEEYGYLKGVGMESRNLEDMTPNPVLWMNQRKEDMKNWTEYPWGGYKFKDGGDLLKMPGGGFLGDYTMPMGMGQATKRGSFEYRFRPSYNTTMGTTGQLDFRKGWQGRDRQAFHNILGNVYGGKNQFGTTAGGSLGYGMQYNWNPDMNTYLRTDAGYDKQLGVNAGLEAGHRWNIVPTKQLKSGAKHSGSFDAFGGFGVHSKPDQRLAEYTPVFDNSGQIIDWSPEGFNRHVKFNYGVGANYQRELGPGKLGVFGKVIMDPAGGKILRTQGVPLEEDTGLMERIESGKVNWKPNFTAGLTYTMDYDPYKKKNSKQVAKAKARDEAIEREQEMLARREEERRRQQEGEREFVKGSATPLEQQFGGEVMELTDKEIQELRKGGHLVIEQ